MKKIIFSIFIAALFFVFANSNVKAQCLGGYTCWLFRRVCNGYDAAGNCSDWQNTCNNTTEVGPTLKCIASYPGGALSCNPGYCDCGLYDNSCEAPGPPPSSPPQDNGPVCGNGICESGEDSNNCPYDCGSGTSGDCCAGGNSCYNCGNVCNDQAAWDAGYADCNGGGGGGGAPPNNICVDGYTCPDGSQCGPGSGCKVVDHDADGNAVWGCQFVGKCASCKIIPTQANAEVPIGGSVQLDFNYTEALPNAKPVTFSSADTSIATVFPASWQGGGSNNYRYCLTKKNGKCTQWSTAEQYCQVKAPTLNPCPQISPPYTTFVTGVSIGQVKVTAHGSSFNSPFGQCSTFTFVNVVAPGPWWQAKDGDVTATSINSSVPSGNPPSVFLIDKGAGGFPGVATYSSSFDAQSGPDTGNPSEVGWLAHSSTLQKVYDYDYFSHLTPQDTAINNITETSIAASVLSSGGSQSSDGYYWYKTTGNLTINDPTTISLDRKVILFVNGDLTINGNISIDTPGSGYFMAIVKGNIITDSAVTEIDGVYTTSSGQLQTGNSANQLKIKGAIAVNGTQLQRDLGNSNSNTPAELFEYDPALILLYPQSLNQFDIRWQEIAP